MRKSKPKLYLRFTTPEGKQSGFHRAAFDSRSRIRPFWCVVNGTGEHHPDAHYYRRIKRSDGKLSWESLGRDYADAWGTTTADTKLTKTEKVPGLDLYGPEPAAPVPVKAKDGYRLDDEVREYLTNAAKLAAKTYKAYKKSLELFQESCKKTHVHQITKQDLQAFDTSLLRRGSDDRTRSNRVGHVVTFIRNEQGRRPGPPITDVTHHNQVCRLPA